MAAPPRQKKKAPRIPVTSPKGMAAYAHVERPDDRFPPARFKLTLVLDDDAEGRAFEARVIKLGKQSAEKGGVHLSKNFRTPFTRWDDDAPDKRRDEFKDKIRVTYTARAVWPSGDPIPPPRRMDSQTKPLPASVNIWGGDIVRVGGRVQAYEGLGGGLTLSLDAVQLIEKRSGGGDVPDYFEPEEGGFTAEAGDAPREDDLPPVDAYGDDDRL